MLGFIELLKLMNTATSKTPLKINTWTQNTFKQERAIIFRTLYNKTIVYVYIQVIGYINFSYSKIKCWSYSLSLVSIVNHLLID